MKQLDTTAHLYAPAQAEAIAAALQADDDDWRYVVRHDPKGTGYSVIDIYDEIGVRIGTY